MLRPRSTRRSRQSVRGLRRERRKWSISRRSFTYSRSWTVLILMRCEKISKRGGMEPRSCRKLILNNWINSINSSLLLAREKPGNKSLNELKGIGCNMLIARVNFTWTSSLQSARSMQCSLVNGLRDLLLTASYTLLYPIKILKSSISCTYFDVAVTKNKFSSHLTIWWVS